MLNNAAITADLIEVSHPSPPSTKQLFLELPHAGYEFYQLSQKRWKKQLEGASPGDGHSVITVPGFGGGDGSMAFLRRYLNKLGYNAHPWGLGTNIPKQRVTMLSEVLNFCEQMESNIADVAEKIAERTGEKVSLVGWSMGGIYANSLAQTRPDIIRQVITLGSPIGDPRGTSTWNLLKRLNRSDVPDHLQEVDPWIARKTQQGEREVQTSILYSMRDGAVSRESAVIEGHDKVENIEVPSSHIGFAHNPLVYWVIADRLSQNPIDWQPFNAFDQPLMIRKCLNTL